MSKYFVQIPLQVFNYTLFMGLIWYFSINPAHHQLDKDQAMITFTLGHVGKRVEECRRLTQEELLKLAPNMRRPMECSRERSPITMELQMDGKVIYRHTAPPLGLYKDQGIDIYQNIKVPVGEHRLFAWVNDDINVDGPIYTLEQDVNLKPEQHLIVEFKSATGSFTIK